MNENIKESEETINNSKNEEDQENEKIALEELKEKKKSRRIEKEKRRKTIRRMIYSIIEGISIKLKLKGGWNPWDKCVEYFIVVNFFS
jgi:hypothetical protein